MKADVNATLRFQCPCCGYYTRSSWNTVATCPICGWRGDAYQIRNPARRGSRYSLNLWEARRQVIAFGRVQDPDTVVGVRPPQPVDMPPVDLDDLRADLYFPLFPIDEPLDGDGVEPPVRLKALIVNDPALRGHTWSPTPNYSGLHVITAYVYRSLPVSDNSALIPAPDHHGQAILPGWQNHQEIAVLEGDYEASTPEPTIYIHEFYPHIPVGQQVTDSLLSALMVWLEAWYPDATRLTLDHFHPRYRTSHQANVSQTFLNEQGFRAITHGYAERATSMMKTQLTTDYSASLLQLEEAEEAERRAHPIWGSLWVDLALSPEEMAALRQAEARLDTANPGQSLELLLRRWSDLVQRVESGYEWGEPSEYGSDLFTRNILNQLLHKVPDSVRQKVTPLLEPWDERWKAATIRVKESVNRERRRTGPNEWTLTPMSEASWWSYRIPKAGWDPSRRWTYTPVDES